MTPINDKFLRLKWYNWARIFFKFANAIKHDFKWYQYPKLYFTVGKYIVRALEITKYKKKKLKEGEQHEKR